MDTTYIAKLPPKQRDVLGLIAIGEDGGHPASVLKALMRKGLIIPHQQNIYGKGNSPMDRIPVIITHYEVPLEVHSAWAAWCAEQPEEEPWKQAVS